MNSKIANTKVKKAKNLNSEKVERSSGNVFADLGFHDAEERMWKAQLATKISQLIESKGWTQVQTSERLGLVHPKISNLMRGRPSGFSADRLSTESSRSQTWGAHLKSANPEDSRRTCPVVRLGRFG